MTIRVLLADDHAMIRGALAALLSLEGDIEVVTDVGRGDEVVEAVRAHDVDVAVLDIEMPGSTGLAAKADMRAAGLTAKVLILTTFARTGYLKEALASGAKGFMVKDTPPDRLASAIRAIAAGETVLDPQLAAEAVSGGDNPLTDRECDVLRASLTGATIRRISQTLHLSEGTVRNYLSAAMAKAGGATRVEAARIAQGRGWL